MNDESRGIDAQQVLQNAVFKEAFAIIEDRLVSELAQIEISAERANYLRTLLIANRKIRGYLQQVMLTGQMAAMEEERKRTVLDYAKRAISRMSSRY